MAMCLGGPTAQNQRVLLEELGWETSRVTLEHDTNAALLAEAVGTPEMPSSGL